MSDDRIHALLLQLNKVTGILGSMIISYPTGIPLDSTWQKELESITASGLVTSVKLTLDNLYRILRKSQLTRVYVESEKGNFIIMNAGSRAIIITFLDKYANVPACSFEIHNVSLKLEKWLI